MLELHEIASVFSGISVRERERGTARFIKLADLTDIRAGLRPSLAQGEAPGVARAFIG
jgi:hypothetical protein